MAENINPGSHSGQSSPDPGASEPSGSHKIAVLLNENAKKVTRRVKRSISDIIPRAGIYTSKTSEEAYQHVKDIIDRGYERIFSGGGDGSLTQLVNMVRRYVDEKNRQLESLSQDVQKRLKKINYPSLGILKLGTGNGMAYFVGSKRGMRNIRKTLTSPVERTIKLSLIEAEERCFTFSGLGWDAAIQNDFLWLREKFQWPSIRRWVGGLGGYLASLAIRTIPREIFRRKAPEVTIRSTGGPVYRVIPPGDLIPLEIAPGDVIYQGPVNVTGVGTVPYYGFKVRAFPYARMRKNLMNLRIVKTGVFKVLYHAPAIWAGRYTGEGFQDYLTSGITMEFSESMPFQMGGDPCGYRNKVTYTISDHEVEVVDFR